MQEGEAAFHGLRGDIRFKQKRFDDAITNYDRAVARDPEYYAYYLGRGMARAEQEQRDGAKADFNRSLKLLPTTIAYLELGKIAEAEGNREAAEQYYRAAGVRPAP